MQYRVLSNAEIEIQSIDKTELKPDFPFSNYPDAYPSINVRLVDPEAIEFDEDMEESWECYWDDDPERDPTPIEMVGMHLGVSQPLTDVACLNDECDVAEMRPLAAFTGEWLEDEGVSIWGGQEYVAMVFWICPKCLAIQSANLVN